MFPAGTATACPSKSRWTTALGRKKLKMAPLEVRRICREYAEKYLDLQRYQFKRIGVFGRFDQPYSTMTPQYESVVIADALRLLRKGRGLQGLAPGVLVHPRQHRAGRGRSRVREPHQPQHLGEVRAHQRPGEDRPELAGKTVSTIIWTTTPWTLPASMAVAFHPEEEYVRCRNRRLRSISSRRSCSRLRKRLPDWQRRSSSSRPSPAAGWSTRPSPILSSTARSSACWPSTSPWTRAPAPCTPRLRTAPTTSTPA